MSKFKVGDRVTFTETCGNVTNSHAGLRATVRHVERPEYMGPFSVGLEIDGFGLSGATRGLYWPHIEYITKSEVPITKEQKAIAKAEADLAKLKERAALKEKAAAERKAKAEREKLMRGLSPAGRRVVELLRVDTSSFGCQRASVVVLAAAITGDNADKIRKAIA